MVQTLIIGYGNPLRGDDCLGWEAAELLAGMVRNDTVEVLAVHQLSPELAESISEAEQVIFIDASHEGQPGTWKCEPIWPATESNALGHHFTPGGLLACAQAIFNASPAAFLISVAGGSFEYGETLTPPVATALPEVVRRVCDQISHHDRTPSHA
jgi:hydrogenase maturation protease